MKGIVLFIRTFAFFCLIGSLSGAVPGFLFPYFLWGSLIVLVVTADMISN